MPLEEGFLLLGWEGHHEEPPRVAQAHVKDLDGHLFAGDLSHGFPPVHLGIGTRVELQRQIDLRLAPFAPPLADVAPHRGFAPWVAGLFDLLEDLVAGIALLTGQMLIRVQQFINPLLEWSENGRRTRLTQSIGSRLRRLDGFVHRLPGDVQFFGNLPQGLLVDEVGSPDLLAVFHTDHPFLRTIDLDGP